MAVKILSILQNEPRGKSDIASGLEMKAVTGALNRSVRDLKEAGFIEYTIPGKPKSRLQKYRLTEKGRAFLADER